MNNDSYDEKEDMTFMERHRIGLSIAAVAIISVGIFILQSKFSKPGSSQRKGPEIVSIRLPAPVPTPPPPAPTPPPPEIKEVDKMVEVAPPVDDVPKPVENPDTAPLTTNNTATGSDAFNLTHGTGGGSLVGSTRKYGKWDWYSSQVRTTIREALSKNPLLRNASGNVEIRLFPDITGRVTRVKLGGSMNDPKVDEAIIEALTGIQLKEALPAGLKPPIVSRFTAQRPN